MTTMEYSGELPSCIYIALVVLTDNQSSHIFSLATGYEPGGRLTPSFSKIYPLTPYTLLIYNLPPSTLHLLFTVL